MMLPLSCALAVLHAKTAPNNETIMHCCKRGHGMRAVARSLKLIGSLKEPPTP